MATVALRRVIEASPDHVWSVLTDLPARTRWLCGLGAVEVLTPGRFTTGTTWREHRTLPGGGSQVEEFQVAEAAPPSRLVIVSSGIGVEYRTTYTLRPLPARRGARGRTAVTVVQQQAPTAAASRLVALVLGGFAARAVTGALRRDLADLAAATETPGFSAPGCGAATAA